MILDPKLPFIKFDFQDGVTKKYKRSFIKEYIPSIMALLDEDNYQEKLDSIEKKAVSKYIYFLLSKRDYLSSDLLNKAKAAGFSEHNITPFIENCQLKGFVNDDKLKRRKDLLRIKKGYSIKTTSLSNDEEASRLDSESLKNLIKKKKSLLLSADLKDRARGYRFLISRGYDINQIKQYLQDYEV